MKSRNVRSGGGTSRRPERWRNGLEKAYHQSGSIGSIAPFASEGESRSSNRCTSSVAYLPEDALAELDAIDR